MQIQLLPPPKKACLATRHSANMSKFQKLILCASLVVFTGCAHAAGETAEASLTVTGALGSSIELLFSTAATFRQASNNYGSFNLDLNLERVSRSSELPPGWTRTINETSWTLETNLTATALIYHSDSQTYTLAARTSGLDKTNIGLMGRFISTPHLPPTNINNNNRVIVDSTATYGEPKPATLLLVINNTQFFRSEPLLTSTQPPTDG